MGTSKNPTSEEVLEKGVALFYLAEAGGETKGTNLFKKRILYEGKFIHPRDPNKWLHITAEHFRDAIRNFTQGTMDRVQAYYTHNEDPRNVAGVVTALEEGIDPTDGKRSLYAVIKTDDPAAAEMMKNNAVGVSAGIRHEYREHLGGRDVGLTVQHVALVGEGWIKKLGNFIPLPKNMASSAANLEENHEGGVIWFEEVQNKAEERTGKMTITRDELIAQAKEMGLAVVPEAEFSALSKRAQTEARLREEFKFSENDDVVASIMKQINEGNDKVKTFEAETVVGALLTENKITAAQKPMFVELYKTNKPLYESMVATLKPTAVRLGEQGYSESQEPGSETDKQKEIADGLKVMADAGIPLSEETIRSAGLDPANYGFKPKYQVSKV